jgi:hypothetical protein
MPDIYPDERKMALYSNHNYKENALQHSTNTSALIFRKSMLRSNRIYIVLAVLSMLEFVSRLFKDANMGNEWQLTTYVQTSTVLTLSTAFAFMTYHLYLILGHGYKDREAQLYVDSFSTKNECMVTLKIMKQFYLITIMLSVILLVTNFLVADEISNPINQWNALKNLLDVTLIVKGMGGVEAPELYNHQIVPFNLIVTILMGANIIMLMIGLIQSILTSAKNTATIFTLE